MKMLDKFRRQQKVGAPAGSVETPPAIRTRSVPGLVEVYVDPEILEAARLVTQEVEVDIPGASPENKHARAFARMKRVFPSARGTDIGLAIELALR